jgi:NADH-quinone oxidoreductase subunit N
MMDFSILAAEILMALLGLAVLILGLALPQKAGKYVNGLSVSGLSLVLLYLALSYSREAGLFNGVYQIDLYGNYFKILFLSAGILVMLMAGRYISRFEEKSNEFYGLMIFATLGMMLMVSAGEFITLYLGLELMTISFYILTAYLKTDKLSGEAGLKYLILGAISSAILLFGISLIYASLGSTNFIDIGASFTSSAAVIAGMAMIIAGFAFKVSVVPFHMWTPDIYQGAPIPVTTYLSVASKAAGFAALLRVFMAAADQGSVFNWSLLLAVLAALTIIIGNLIALSQQDIKRLLAYSSIAQAGYILVGLAAANSYGLKGVLFYAMIYVFANVGAFAVAAAVEADTGRTDIEAFAGLSKRSPLLAAIMTICMLSLAGIPPMAGFAGKFYLFAGAIEAGYLWLALLGLVMSMVSVYYYLGVSKAMYIGENSDQAPVSLGWGSTVALWVCVLATILLGVYPGPLSQLAGYAIQIFM